MKLLFFLIIILLSSTASRAGWTTAEGPDLFAVRGVAADDALNIRSEPSAKGKVVGRIPHNAGGIENLGDVYPPPSSDLAPAGWCRIRYQGIEGWAACRYLMED